MGKASRVHPSKVHKKNKASKSRRNYLANNSFPGILEIEKLQSSLLKESQHKIDDSFSGESQSPLLENSFCMSDNTYQGIMEHELCTEEDDVFSNTIPGHRIVDLGYVLKWAFSLQHNHSKLCSGILYPIKELDRGLGLVRHIEFKCSECDIDTVKSTEDPKNEPSNINYGAVWGTLATGSTFSHLEELLSSMNIPPLNQRKFNEIENKLGETWHDQLCKDMEVAAFEEATMAIERGDVDPDGIPFITVCLDGGWSHRTYGHNYNASSGGGVIIGQKTSKVLYIGIRNKYCIICARAANKKELPKQHKCFRNWSGSSSAMEADIIVEGFCFGEEAYKLRFKSFIADGDSSVYAKIVQRVPYGRFVKKIECTNHSVKNYGKVLYSIQKDTKMNLAVRKLITNKIIKDLQKVAQKAIYNCDNVDDLRRDLRNGPLHVFGDHLCCQNYYYSSVGNNSASKKEEMKKTGLYNHIYSALEILLKKSHQLVDNQTNNKSENYMSILARFNAGKRLNLTSRGFFQTRCFLSGMRFNKGFRWHTSPWKAATNKSPGKYFKNYISRQTNKSKAKKKLFPSVRKEKTKLPQIKNQDYGPNALQPELPERIQEESERILQKLQVSEERRSFIEEHTKLQFACELYKTERADRLTASHFGEVIKKRMSTSCHIMVNKILYTKFINTPAVEYGKTKEKVAITKLEESRALSVQDAGLFIDQDYGFLAATPDGLVGDDSTVEVKCLYKVSKLEISLEKAAEDYNICLEKTQNGLRLKRNHVYWFQIQGQLNISKRKKCYFVVYVNDTTPLFIEEIERDEFLWQHEMLPILVKFYNDCVLQEEFQKDSNVMIPPTL